MYIFCCSDKKEAQRRWAIAVLNNSSSKAKIKEAIIILKQNKSYDIDTKNYINKLIIYGVIDKNFNILDISKIKYIKNEKLGTESINYKLKPYTEPQQ